MIYLALGVMALAISFFPWWSIAGAGLILGALLPSGRKVAAQMGLAAGTVWAAWAYIRDSQNYGLISQRMSGVFGLPYAWMIFAVVFVLGFITAYLCTRAGHAMKESFRIKDQ